MYKVKYKADETLDKYKAHLVTRGFSQREGIDYEKTFAPTTKLSTIRLVLALAAQFGWKVYQMDVKSAFLEKNELVYDSASKVQGCQLRTQSVQNGKSTLWPKTCSSLGTSRLISTSQIMAIKDVHLILICMSNKLVMRFCSLLSMLMT